jgi:putative transposase
LQPTPEQKRTLNRWFGCARNTYNTALKLIEDKVCAVNHQALRDRCVKNELFKGTDQAWRLETPYEIRDQAVADLVKAFKTNWASERPNGFNIRPKRKKADSDSIVIGSRQWKGTGVVFPKFMGKTPIKAREPLPGKLDYDTRLQRTRLGKFYLCVLAPRYKREGPIPLDDGSSVIAFDPGVRTVLTGYSPDGSITEIGKGESKRIERLLRHLDKLQSKCKDKTATAQQRYQRRRAALRMRAKLKHLVHDVHHKVAKFLCLNYRTVLLPVFGTQKQMKKAGRKIGPMTVRLMATWSHYRFRQILIDKARSYPWCAVYVVDEYHTTKTCGNCGELNHQVKNKRTFVCPSCGFHCGRDTNAARNVLLRFMTRDDRVRDWRSYLGLGPGPW